MSWNHIPITGILNHRVHSVWGDFALVEGAFIMPRNSYHNCSNFICNTQRRHIRYRRHVKTAPKDSSASPVQISSGNAGAKRSHSNTDEIYNKNAKINGVENVHTHHEEKGDNAKPSCSQSDKTMSKSEPKGDASLEVAIIDKNQKILTREQVNLIKTKLMEALDECLYTETPPQFQKVDFETGHIIFKCANLEARQWLEKVLGVIEVWKGADLFVVNKDMTKRSVLKVTIDGVTCSVEEVLKKIRYQNPELDVTEWSVLSCEKQDGRLELTVHVDMESFFHLESKKFKIYFALGVLEFEVIEGFKNQ